MKPKPIYQEQQILNASKIGFEFEFYSKLDKEIIIRDLGSFLGKRIVIPLTVPALGQDPMPLYHSPITPTSTIYKLEPDYSGGLDMYELVTGPLEYKEAVEQLQKITQWIDENGYTTDKCGIHINHSFDFNQLRGIRTIDKMNPLKCIMSFNEDYIYELWPERKHNVYAQSIKSIVSNDVIYYSKLPLGQFENNFKLPSEKYFGINFLKYPDNYLEFRYLGGADYHKKYEKIFKVIQHIALEMYKILREHYLSTEEKEILNKKIVQFRELVNYFRDPYIVKQIYKDITITVDLKPDLQILKTYWNEYKDKIFDLVFYAGFKIGSVNYNTETSQYEISGAKLGNGRLENVLVVDSEISDCSIEHCQFINCDLQNVRMHYCDLKKGNEVLKSKVENTHIKSGNELTKCFIKNDAEKINGIIKGGVIRCGEVGDDAECSDDVMFVDKLLKSMRKETKMVYSTDISKFKF